MDLVNLAKFDPINQMITLSLITLSNFLCINKFQYGGICVLLSVKYISMSSAFSPLRGRRIYYQLIVAWKQTCQEARIIFTLNFCKQLFRSTKGLLAKQIITFAFSNSSFRIIVNHYVEYVVCLKYFKVRTKLSLLKIKVDHYLLNR